MKPLCKTALDVLDILCDGLWHHGSDIADALSVSRTAIWKQINTLKDLGYELNTDRIKGYQLAFPQTPLLSNQVFSYLGTIDNSLKLDIETLPKVNSTSDHLKQAATTCEPQICLAEQQLQGRGRYNRAWCSPFGENIYLSIKTQLAMPIAEFSGFSLCISLAIVQALIACGFSKELFQIKWPNDVLINGQKLSGVLIELSCEAGSGVQAIIGIGLNVNMLKADIDKKWTALCQHTTEAIDRNKISAYLINEVFKTIHQFKQQGFQSFQSAWQQFDVLINQSIELSFYDSTISGVCQGIDEEGNILLKHNDGRLKSYSAGEVSTRKQPS